MEDKKRNSSNIFSKRKQILLKSMQIKRKTMEIFYNENFINILKFYFLIHGINFNANNKNYSSTKLVSIILAIFYEINAWIYFYFTVTIHDLTQSKDITKLMCYIFFFLIDLRQRFYMFKKNKTFIKLLTKIIEIQSVNSVINARNIKSSLLIFIICVEVIKLLTYCVFAYLSISEESDLNIKKLFNTNSNSFLTFICINIFFLHWKNTYPCVTIQFNRTCFLIKSLLHGIEGSAFHFDEDINKCISLFNHTLAITKELNDFFQTIFITSFIITLGLVFQSAFNLIGCNDILYIILETLYLILPLLCFIIICLSSSSLSSSVKNTKNLLLKLRNLPRKDKRKHVPKIMEDFDGFTIFDSITIDKSFILSSFGTLLTYGVMIATFNQVK